MTKTNYTKDGKEIFYEIIDNGYNIYLDITLWITQTKENMPYPSKTLEESCLQQLADLFSEPKQSEIDKLQAQIDYLAVMSDTNLEV